MKRAGRPSTTPVKRTDDEFLQSAEFEILIAFHREAAYRHGQKASLSLSEKLITAALRALHENKHERAAADLNSLLELIRKCQSTFH